MDEHNPAVHLAVLAGKIDTVIARMEAGDRQSAQLVTLVKDQLTYQAADLGELKAVVRESILKQEKATHSIEEKHDRAITAVRLDLEAKLATAVHDIEDLKMWKARIGGIAVASAAFSSVVTGAVIKAIGA